MKKNAVGKNAALNLIRTMVGILSPLITFPYVSRVLQPENMGKLNWTNSISGYFGMLAALGFTTYALQQGARIRKDQEKTSEFLSQVFSMFFWTTVATTILMISMVFLVPRLRSYKSLFFILAAGLFLSVFSLEWVFILYEQLTYLTLRTLAVQLLCILCMFLFVRQKEDYVWYCAITILISNLANLVNLWQVQKLVKLRLTLHCHWKKHIRPVMVLFVNNLAVMIYVDADTTMLGIFAGDIQVGLYGVATKIYTIIKTGMNAVLNVMIPQVVGLVTEEDNQPYQDYLEQIIKGVIILVLPVITGICMVHREIVVLTAGEAYAKSGNALMILSLALVFAILGAVLGNLVLLPHERSVQVLKATSAGAVTNIVLNLAAIPLWGINGAAATTVISEALVALMNIRQGKDLIAPMHLKETLIHSLLANLGIAVICLSLRKILGIWWLYLLCAVILSMAAYAGILLLLKDTWTLQLLKRLRKK